MATRKAHTIQIIIIDFWQFYSYLPLNQFGRGGGDLFSRLRGCGYGDLGALQAEV